MFDRQCIGQINRRERQVVTIQIRDVAGGIDIERNMLVADLIGNRSSFRRCTVLLCHYKVKLLRDAFIAINVYGRDGDSMSAGTVV